MTAEKLGLVLARVEVRRCRLRLEYLEWYEESEVELVEGGAEPTAGVKKVHLDVEMARLDLEVAQAKLELVESMFPPSVRNRE